MRDFTAETRESGGVYYWRKEDIHIGCKPIWQCVHCFNVAHKRNLIKHRKNCKTRIKELK